MPLQKRQAAVLRKLPDCRLARESRHADGASQLRHHRHGRRHQNGRQGELHRPRKNRIRRGRRDDAAAALQDTPLEEQYFRRGAQGCRKLDSRRARKAQRRLRNIKRLRQRARVADSPVARRGRLQSEARFDTLPPHGPFRRRNRILRDLPPARQGGRGRPPNIYGHTQAEGRHQRPHGLQCRIQRQAVLGRARRHPRTAGGRPADEPRRNGRRVLGKNRQTPRGRFRFQLGIQKGLPRRLHPKEYHRRHRRIRAHPHNARQPV